MVCLIRHDKGRPVSVDGAAREEPLGTYRGQAEAGVEERETRDQLIKHKKNLG